MKRILALVFVLPLLGGCIVHTRPAHSRRTVIVKERRCAPSHHWNGSYCEHNGRGRGARKHDY